MKILKKKKQIDGSNKFYDRFILYIYQKIDEFLYTDETFLQLNMQYTAFTIR